MTDERLSRHFDWHELCPRGVPSDPNVVAALQRLADHVLDPIREAVRSPIIVTSGYRSPAHNEAVGGAKDSYHVRGMAADITSGYARWTPIELAKVACQISALGGLGLYAPVNRMGSFIHVDTRPRVRGKITTWYYSASGGYGPLPADIRAALVAANCPI